MDELDDFIRTWQKEENERARFQKRVTKEPWLDLAKIMKSALDGIRYDAVIFHPEGCECPTCKWVQKRDGN